MLTGSNIGKKICWFWW